MERNTLSERDEREDCRRKKFKSIDEKLLYDADKLIALAKTISKREKITVSPNSLITREDDDVPALTTMIGIRLKNPSTNDGAGTGTENIQEINDVPSIYKVQYDKLPDNVKSRCTWEELSIRLLAQKGYYLNLAKDLQDGGEFVFIDKEGNPVFRDGGVEPVFKGKSYNEIKKILYGDDNQESGPHYGYEMPNDVKELREIEVITKRPFVASDNRQKWRATYMESGKNPFLSRVARFNPDNGNVYVYDADYPYSEDSGRGLVRLLRVQKRT
ncbi:hypothetical protein HYV56_00300 [Candidatus Peregrinibacteria bacterium]|nr:hypothetical protein [Candidatus Peregrinibacteria bacterium]